MDATLLDNEMVNSRKRQEKPRILCKLDIEKTYDHVNWNFLLKKLKDMGFGSKWIGWINNCISNVKFSLLVNGNSEGFFLYHRGRCTTNNISGTTSGFYEQRARSVQCGIGEMWEESSPVKKMNNDTMEQVQSQQGWNLLYRRALNDCEIKEVAKLLEVLKDFLGDAKDYFGASKELEEEGKRKNGGSSNQHVDIGPYGKK
ncbi:hypothetical protein MTR67_048041 [Solanum verrucosum]|uniref:Reverse transcriptase domain-containing protein n=1 Tax=Solanum verrucosum TaxID=315347 RepID=A0AAF0V0V3_SOLVR|nr:hypothetical protein MTR67_048041 [Solanum verrucosum]